MFALSGFSSSLDALKKIEAVGEELIKDQIADFESTQNLTLLGLKLGLAAEANKAFAHYRW